jgi:hypothetical protein
MKNEDILVKIMTMIMLSWSIDEINTHHSFHIFRFDEQQIQHEVTIGL